jgi:outer membrane protein
MNTTTFTNRMGVPMKLRAAFLILALAAAASPAVMAQRSLTIDEAVRIATERNRDIEVARLQMDKADYQVSEAVGTALPTISASGTYIRALKKPVFFLPDFQNPESGRIIPIEIGSDNSYQLGLTATQVLFNAAVFTGVGTAKIYQHASRHLYNETYNKTVADVKKAFYGVLFVKDVHRMVQASLANAEKNLANVQLLFDQGIVSEYDLIRARVQTDNIRPGVIEAERNVQLALNGLKMLLSMPPGEQVDVQGELRFEPFDPGLIENASSLAVENNSGLRALEDQMRVNEQLVTIYKSESLPTLAAFGDYQWQAQNEHLGRISTNDFVRSSQVGVQLSLNLFNGLQTSARVDQARVDMLQTQQQLSMAKDGMITNTQNIRFRLDEARKRIESQTSTVEQAEKGYSIATVRYQDGSGTQLEVNDADLALMRARVNRVQAVYDYLVASADLEHALSLHHPKSK